MVCDIAKIEASFGVPSSGACHYLAEKRGLPACQ